MSDAILARFHTDKPFKLDDKMGPGMFFTALGPVEFSTGAVDLERGGNAAVETTVWPQMTGEIVLCTRSERRKWPQHD